MAHNDPICHCCGQGFVERKELPMIPAELAELKKSHFLALILDNEVTVGHFVTEPPLAWLRLVQRDGVFQIADGYPSRLTAEQADFEMTNWDEVSLPAIARLLGELGEGVDYVVIGNNAGQGLPLARSLPNESANQRAAVVYAQRLPELKHYEQLGYRAFWRREQAVNHLNELARHAGRPLALGLINTIQHNEANYHTP
jgi:hypothetical protein